MNPDLEVVLLSVSDLDLSKESYKGLGWREDAGIVASDDFCLVQLTRRGRAPRSISVQGSPR